MATAVPSAPRPALLRPPIDDFMHLWILNPYEPLPWESGAGLRYCSLAEAWLSAGGGPASGSNRVTWWSANWSHVRKAWREDPPESYQIGAFQVRLLRVPPYSRNISWRRVWSHRAYARAFRRAALDEARLSGPPDLILFSLPPMEAGTDALHLRDRLWPDGKVVLDVMDSWPETLHMVAPRWPGGRLLTQLCLKPYWRMLDRYLRKADAVCTQSSKFAQWIADRSPVTDSVSPVFYLGARQPDPAWTTPRSEAGEKSPTFAYLGSMGKGVYDLETLVRAYARLSGSSKADPGAGPLLFIGEGEQRESLEQLAAELGVAGQVHFTGYLSGEALHRVLAEAQIGLVPMWPESGVAVPYKVGDYLAHGLAVISSLPGELETLLSEPCDPQSGSYGCGMRYDAGDPESLRQAMEAMTRNPTRLAAMQANALTLFEAKFNRLEISRHYAQWLRDLAGKKRESNH